MNCGLPDLGTLNYHIIEGSVDAAIVNEFLINLLKHYTTQHQTSGQRALILDNVSSHRTHNAYASIHTEAMRNVLCVEYLPLYSPFLNPVEEVFAQIKFRLAATKSHQSVTDESKAAIKQSLVHQVETITKDHLISYQVHVEQFLAASRNGIPVLTSHMHESSHQGDETRTPATTDVEAITIARRHLPTAFSQFTAEDHVG
ncbi:TPA: hypothetical protein N0F65_006858 [Lagenidium giganteum]|uniref:Tc1-like transposase DDE domain-containing protein n=1 Tax=Lagenidium giganteum TaxID=4803 RepID=A0AAV2YG47_9STRA|nr:TPA: hypothetical protein N0F65_006858 [Lagenidium giganteum]